MNRLLLIVCFVVFGFALHAQNTEAEETLKKQLTDSTDGWKKGGLVSINFTQSSFSNWSAGGQNSLAGNGLVNLYANYKRGKGFWENRFEAAYGTIKQESNSDWWKTDDELELSSKYGRKATKNWYYAALLDFKTQLGAGYSYPDDSTKISDFFAPAYVISAVGMDYKPTDNFTLFLAPITSKMTFMSSQFLADQGAFGVKGATYDPLTELLLTQGKRSRIEMGGYVRMFYKREVMKNITAETKLDLFSNYLENPENIDVSWEVLMNLKVNKFISATVTTHLLYDDDIKIGIDEDNDGVNEKEGPRLQFKEVLALGFSYKF